MVNTNTGHWMLPELAQESIISRPTVSQRGRTGPEALGPWLRTPWPDTSTCLAQFKLATLPPTCLLPWRLCEKRSDHRVLNVCFYTAYIFVLQQSNRVLKTGSVTSFPNDFLWLRYCVSNQVFHTKARAWMTTPDTNAMQLINLIVKWLFSLLNIPLRKIWICWLN